MTNSTIREPHLNSLVALVPLSTLDDTGTTGTALDLLDTNAPNHIVAVTISDLTDIARVFVTVEESPDGTNLWKTITQFSAMTAAGIHQKVIKRTKRFIRAKIVTEPPALPTAPAFNVAVLLLS